MSTLGPARWMTVPGLRQRDFLELFAEEPLQKIERDIVLLFGRERNQVIDLLGGHHLGFECKLGGRKAESNSLWGAGISGKITLPPASSKNLTNFIACSRSSSACV